MNSKGRIDYFNRSRGFGFIYEEGQTDEKGLWFHATAIVSGEPLVGREVAYERGLTSKGPVAINVHVLVPNASAPAIAALVACGESEQGGVA